MGNEHLTPFAFRKGQPKTPGAGRKKGVRNRISEAFLKDVHREWQRSGANVLKIMAVEEPAKFAQLVGSLIPKDVGDELPSLQVIVTGVPRGNDGDSAVTINAPRLQAPVHSDD
jgi:hypothetical protein